MKALIPFLLSFAVFITSCQKDDFGKPCNGCTTTGEISKQGLLLNVHVNLPPEMAGDPTKIVDEADLTLADASTREVIARKRVAVKGNGDVLDWEGSSSNTALLYSSQVALHAPFGWYLLSLGTQEFLIDCRYGTATVAFTF